MSVHDYNPSSDYHCPLCFGKLVRVLTSIAFTLTGGGWFKEGY